MRHPRFCRPPFWRPARRGTVGLATGLLVAVALAACTTPRVAIESHESFDSGSTYSRTFPTPDVQTCEAARRALLSQGYLIAAASSEQVRARKHFQPAADLHVEVDFTVVCAKQGYRGLRTVAFANAVQDSYALKKSSTSASLGLPAFGAVSVPFVGSDEALVKVASVTISSGDFYERFFQLLERFLAGDPGQLLPPSPPMGSTLDLPVPPRSPPAPQPLGAPAGASAPGTPAAAAPPGGIKGSAPAASATAPAAAAASAASAP